MGAAPDWAATRREIDSVVTRKDMPPVGPTLQFRSLSGRQQHGPSAAGLCCAERRWVKAATVASARSGRTAGDEFVAALKPALAQFLVQDSGRVVHLRRALDQPLPVGILDRTKQHSTLKRSANGKGGGA